MRQPLTKLMAVSIAAATFTPITSASHTEELRVIGTIIPAACVPTLSDGGVIDFGYIPKGIMNESTHTSGLYAINYSISCDGPAKILLTIIDNRETHLDAPNDAHYGLGSQAGKSLGHYTLNQTKNVADGHAVKMLVTEDGGNTWTEPRFFAYRSSTSVGVSFTDTSSHTPSSYTTYNGTIHVSSQLTRTSQLDFSSSILIDGLATLNITYL